jgi:hypothetical protein
MGPPGAHGRPAASAPSGAQGVFATHPDLHAPDDELDHADIGSRRRELLRHFDELAGTGPVAPALASFDFHHVSVRWLMPAFAA